VDLSASEVTLQPRSRNSLATASLDRMSTAATGEMLSMSGRTRWKSPTTVLIVNLTPTGTATIALPPGGSVTRSHCQPGVVGKATWRIGGGVWGTATAVLSRERGGWLISRPADVS